MNDNAGVSKMSVAERVLSGKTWDEFCDALKAAGRDILENSAADELERAEGFRYLARLSAHGLRNSFSSAALSAPAFNYDAPKIGANNPDFLYGVCRISGACSYRIRGRANAAFNFNIGAYHGSLGRAEGLQCSGFLPSSALQYDADGSFVISASRTRQPGNWLQLRAESSQLLVRQTILKPGRDTPATLDVEIIEGDARMALEPLSAEQLDRALGMSAMTMHGIVRQFIGWTNDFRKRPNEIHPIAPELLGLARGDPNSQYNYGYFDLADDEVLLIRLQPPACEYWNIQLANHWMESLDNPDIASSINLANAEPRTDGSVHVAISRCDPGLPNWLNTQGHLRGVIALRWVGAPPQQAPLMRCLKLAALGPESFP